VRAYDAKHRAGALSRSVRVKVPKRRAAHPAPAPTTNPVPALATPVPSASPPPAPTPSPTATATPTPPPDPGMTAAMVDRLFWRAGFGPSQAQRDAWVGRRPADLVDWFLNTPAGAPPYDRPADQLPPKESGGAVIDPLASDAELELEWVDRMQRAANPFPDRLAFFWHRHWAISREEGAIPIVFVLRYRDLLLRHAEFATRPAATFRDLALAMTTADAAMSLYLNINQNVAGKPNENYAREFMELFCLGPTAPDGETPNYSQTDVAELARAFTGWSLNTRGLPNPDYGKITFVPRRFDAEAKTLFQDNPYSPPVTLTTADEAVDAVLAHANHAQFLIRKLWAEFIAGPIPQPTLDALVAGYRSSGYRLKPLLRGILTHPLIFESIDEPNLVKPPIVALAGALRAVGAPLIGNTMERAMIAMQQRVYNPPNVAGWEGGLSWFNTNTVQARFDLVAKVLDLKYGRAYTGTASPVADPGTTPEEAYAKAYDAVNRPWLAAGTVEQLTAYAAGAPAATLAQRRARFYALQVLMLGGPDGQVM
jgi:uncharacterized protein (DUF1800 family)